jgi:arsenate reductase
MSQKAIIYHNPRCSKSRQTLQLLEENNMEVEIVDYLNNPPSANTLKEILTLLDVSADQIIRKKEAAFKELNLKEATGAEMIKAIVKHPILLERPIVIANGKAAIGRPPENVLNII